MLYEVITQPKKVSEAYLIDAVSFTEAETRIYKEMEALISGEFVVTNINKANYAEIFPNDDGVITSYSIHYTKLYESIK